jgi:hypothetical protein
MLGYRSVTVSGGGNVIVTAKEFQASCPHYIRVSLAGPDHEEVCR